ncbi:putative homeobox protein knotted-1 [Hibiscus syriacus]|uniref:Homeobox protein knotted-1 n=1 Tax=Hibiscus syriacus TaxID=106335 RepID=A0A6A3CFP1_HIBSY|nr:ubiquitin carboxyl-terminal hydrolase MINDY-1-like [Hibiscus syriacus]KAE8728043.1 putative homeobox protein knotted-1 [Hibiscus syriacus]
MAAAAPPPPVSADAPSSSSSPSPLPLASTGCESKEEAVNEELNQEQQQQDGIKECMHKTKPIQFLGRTTPIILQNDNGPCPLLAICNTLLLRNNFNLSSDIAEVSQEKLLSLVAERLIDSNSNVNNKDAGYVENQQQNIADAIDLLPRLATGIDVNIKFRRIDDFEFTRECAIFDLLDIPLYHGWIVDPQDYETASAIGSKSYNSIMGELVTLETRKMEVSCKNNSEDCVDFAAATTATLGVPSPNLTKTRSFDDSPRSVSDQKSLEKGDLDEEEELMRALKLSETESPSSIGDLGSFYIRSCSNNPVSVDSVEEQEGDKGFEHQNLQQHELSLSDNCTSLSNNSGDQTCFETLSKEEFLNTNGVIQDQSFYVKSGDITLSNDVVNKNNVKTMVVKGSSANELLQIEDAAPLSLAKSISTDGNNTEISEWGEKIEIQSKSAPDALDIPNNVNGCDTTEESSVSLQTLGSDASSDRLHHTDVPETFTPNLDGSEPIYEGEECILDSVTTTYQDREPVYEGEVLLAKQADKTAVEDSDMRSKDEITPQQGELIRNFLKNNASQLTFSGLFCLQDGLKERELCVFFRNNHFSTMFKYEGELYLLATDQGYLNQPDLVWEKLNEVNGDTLFMTGNFKEFKVDSHTNGSWDEQNAFASTSDYIASIDSAAQAGLDITSDLQLAIALQQQEFEQPQRQNVQQPPVVGASRLVTGPQVPTRSSGGRNPSSSMAKQDAKSKEKCIVM